MKKTIPNENDERVEIQTIDKQKDRWRRNTFEQDERYRRNVRGRGFHTRTGDIETWNKFNKIQLKIVCV